MISGQSCTCTYVWMIWAIKKSWKVSNIYETITLKWKLWWSFKRKCQLIVRLFSYIDYYFLCCIHYSICAYVLCIFLKPDFTLEGKIIETFVIQVDLNSFIIWISNNLWSLMTFNFSQKYNLNQFLEKSLSVWNGEVYQWA